VGRDGWPRGRCRLRRPPWDPEVEEVDGFMSWVRTFGEEMHPAAIVDRVSGEVRPIYFAELRPEIPTAGPLRSRDWVPGRGSESVQMLYREMMTSIVAPSLKSHGFRRKGQQFDRTTNGCHEYFDFQKDVYNTKYVVSFTVNLGVGRPAWIGGSSVIARRWSRLLARSRPRSPRWHCRSWPPKLRNRLAPQNRRIDATTALRVWLLLRRHDPIGSFGLHEAKNDPAH
jgi:hypothetical protein